MTLAEQVWAEVLDAAADEWYTEPKPTDFPKLIEFQQEYALVCDLLESATEQNPVPWKREV